jgi:hypothetical protein
MATTVLSHIAASNPQKENLATEALAFILNRGPAARSALHQRIIALLGSAPSFSRVTTQVAVGNESRPDLIFLNESGQSVGYIEAKFWAALTAAQPIEYVRRLSDSGGGILVFLAPERRLPTLRAEILERLHAAGIAPEDVGGTSIVVDRVRLGLLSWSALLSTLHDAVSEDREALSDLHQLRGLAERFETEGFIPLTRVELDGLDVPRRLVALTRLSLEIVDVACGEGVLSVKGLKVMPRDVGGGRYAAFNYAGCWIGLDHDLWGRHGRSPIWIEFSAGEWGRAALLREPLRAWQSTDPPRAFAEGDGIQVPLILTVGAERERVVADAVRQIHELDALLRGAGLPTL